MSFESCCYNTANFSIVGLMKDYLILSKHIFLPCGSYTTAKQHDCSSNVKPKCLNLPLVAGFSVGDKPGLLHVSRWDLDQTKKSQVNIKYLFLKYGLCSQVWFWLLIWCSQTEAKTSWLTAETELDWCTVVATWFCYFLFGGSGDASSIFT